jgi:hypothetical protein
MARLAEALAFVMPEAEIVRFPAWIACHTTGSRPTRYWSPSASLP